VRPDIIEFVTDPQGLGLSLSPAQETLLRAVYGLPLRGDEQLDLWRACTGRAIYAPPDGGWGEVTVIAGARAGKDSRIAAPIAVYEALLGGHEERLSRGERGVIPLVASNARQARVAFHYVSDYLQVPGLRGEIDDVLPGRAEITLKNGLALSVFANIPAGVRGWSMPAAVLDELAFFRLEGKATSDVEMQASLRRGMLAFPSPRLVKISTPYLADGVLYDDFVRAFGKDDPDLLVWRATSMQMNPTLTAARLERERRLDPVRYAREYEAAFDSSLAALLAPEAIDACVIEGRREMQPVAGVTYEAFADPSGGRADAFTLAVGHRGGGRAVVDALRAWPAPFNPTGVVEEAAALLRAYRVSRISGDRYAGEWPREAFAKHSVTYSPAEAAKSELYLALVPMVNSGSIELLDEPLSLRQLRLLERRRGPSGRDAVDHPNGGHDDSANAVAGLAALLADEITAAMAYAPGDIPLLCDYTLSRDRGLFGRDR
jgi:hypothetical protein